MMKMTGNTEMISNGKKSMIVMGFLLSMLLVVSAQAFAVGPQLDLTLMRTDPDPVSSGTYFEVVMKVENIGETDASDVTVNIDPQFPFSLAPGEENEKYLGTLEQKSPVTVRYSLYAEMDAVDGINDLEVTYGTGNGITLTKDIPIDIESKSIDLHIGSLDSDPVKLVSDTETAAISVEIQNTGDADAYMVTTTIDLPEGFTPSTSYSDRDTLGTILHDSGKTATYYIDIAKTVPEGIHKAEITIEYKDKTGSQAVYKSMTLELDLPVKGKPNFEITDISTEPEALAPGDTDVKLRLKVMNTGSKKAESVSINIFKKAEQPFDFGEKSDYIGTLDAGDEGYAVLTFSVDEEAELKEYLLDAEIRAVYEDTVTIYEQTVPVSVVYVRDNQASFNERYSAYYPVAAIALALVLCAYLIRRNSGRKKTAKDSKKESKKE